MVIPRRWLIILLDWITQTDSMESLKLATRTMSRHPVLTGFLIEYTEWISPLVRPHVQMMNEAISGEQFQSD